MPIYLYECPVCGHTTEAKQNYRYQMPCPLCGREMWKVPVLPAKTTVGKYGKGGGK